MIIFSRYIFKKKSNCSTNEMLSALKGVQNCFFKTISLLIITRNIYFFSMFASNYFFKYYFPPSSSNCFFVNNSIVYSCNHALHRLIKLRGDSRVFRSTFLRRSGITNFSTSESICLGTSKTFRRFGYSLQKSLVQPMCHIVQPNHTFE